MTAPQKSDRLKQFLERRSFWIGLLVIAAAFTAGAVLTWRKWPDLLGDFGMQLYIPWRLAEGAVLYRDLFYIAGGPLSQYYHGALFKIFGPSFLTLIVSNLVITAVILLVVYQRFRKLTDTVTATLIALAIVVGFAFAQYTGIGNCNFISPYSHEMLHGLALSILALAWMADWLTHKKLVRLLGAGVCAGLVALTKPDIFLALILALLAAFGLAFIKTKPRQLPAKALGLFTLAALVPLAAWFLFFLRITSWRESLRLEFFGWRPVFVPGVVDSPFYQWCLGLDTPFDHTRQTSLYFLVCGVIIALCALLFQRAARLANPWRLLATGAAIVPVLIAAFKFNWVNVGAVLPLLGLVTAMILLRQFRRSPDEPKIIFPLLWTAFGILLLAKQGVFPRIWHTGFTLALPVFVSAVYLLLRLLPDFLEQRFQVPHRPMRAGAMAVLVVALASLANTSAAFYSPKKLAVGRGADAILANGPGGNSVEARNVNLALDWIRTNVPTHATLATLPMGVMLNYLSRHVNPTPCLDWTPHPLAVFGEHPMTAVFEANPPDYIALAEWQTYEFGNRYFGAPSGYGQDVMAWIQKNYQPVALFGSEPLRNGLFGIKILKHQPPAASANSVEKPPRSP